VLRPGRDADGEEEVGVNTTIIFTIVGGVVVIDVTVIVVSNMRVSGPVASEWTVRMM